jgi:hypothetical protein
MLRFLSYEHQKRAMMASTEPRSWEAVVSETLAYSTHHQEGPRPGTTLLTDATKQIILGRE